jgi:hypothetical protein
LKYLFSQAGNAQLFPNALLLLSYGTPHLHRHGVFLYLLPLHHHSYVSIDAGFHPIEAV